MTVSGIGSSSQLSSMFELARQLRSSQNQSSSSSSESTSTRPQPPQGPPPPGLPPEALDAAAETLGMDSSDVADALESGSTLADLAEQQGVSTDDLTSSVAAALKANKPEGAPDLSDDQLNQMASDMINGTQPPPPPSQTQRPWSSSGIDELSDTSSSSSVSLSTIRQAYQQSKTLTDLLQSLLGDEVSL